MLKFETRTQPMHTGTEQFTVTYSITLPEDRPEAYDVKGLYVQFKFRPQFIRLTWKRRLCGEWKVAHSYSDTGSKIYGGRVKKDGTIGEQTGHQEVWRSGYSPLALDGYAASLPGIAELIEQVKAELPD